ncbi:unnamed protein product [Cyclocybe aegerita]|uniref:Uncharacterized protein n=1 Tax=Cyclocybe aegerita TaxID=1973307 RepID=A0A8S0WBK9_CYCAE|nr:unnamed protein product [Cyclocybe aegerita]
MASWCATNCVAIEAARYIAIVRQIGEANMDPDHFLNYNPVNRADATGKFFPANDDLRPPVLIATNGRSDAFSQRCLYFEHRSQFGSNRVYKATLTYNNIEDWTTRRSHRQDWYLCPQSSLDNQVTMEEDLLDDGSLDPVITVDRSVIGLSCAFCHLRLASLGEESGNAKRYSA